MKKISSKNTSKNSKKRKKRRISIYGDELEEEIKPLFEINKDLVFSNIAEMIATSVLEKIILNAFVEIRKKKFVFLNGHSMLKLFIKRNKFFAFFISSLLRKRKFFPFRSRIQ